MPIRHVFLDLDDTLLDFHRAEAIALTGALSDAGIDPTPAVLARYSEINDACWRALENGEMTRAEVLVQRFKRLFTEFFASRSAPDSHVVQKDYEHRLGIGHFFIPGAPELLEALHGRYHLYITSNGTATVQDGRIASADIARYFDRIFISERLGADKPSPAFFDACFAAMPADARREETIIVGDSLTSDIRGGIAAGIHTCHFNRKRKPADPHIVPEYTIYDLAELPPLLEKI